MGVGASIEFKPFESSGRNSMCLENNRLYLDILLASPKVLWQIEPQRIPETYALSGEAKCHTLYFPSVKQHLFGL